MKLLKGIVVLVALFIALPVLGHSAVSPSHTATSKYETFTLGVPTERELPTVGMRLVLPPELDRVTPFVKPGWKIVVKKDAAGKVTELEWTGGNIPAGQKDAFQFTARTPDADATLVWKAYQTYQGGELVAWDQAPRTTSESGEEIQAEKPYSTTEVKADSAVPSDTAVAAGEGDSRLPTVLSIAAVAISLLSLMKKR